MDFLSESWRPIPGYEGIYDASSLGRIRTTPGKTTSSARFTHRVWKSRILKPKVPLSARRHDQRVSLWKDGVCKDYLISRLVAMAWHGLPEDQMTVNHINGDYNDNRPENLEWISRSENIKKGFDSGLFNSIQKPVVLISSNGKTTSFRSMSQASKYLGRNTGYISSYALKGKTHLNSSNGESYTFYLIGG